jgi:hypothetical protein
MLFLNLFRCIGKGKGYYKKINKQIIEVEIPEINLLQFAIVAILIKEYETDLLEAGKEIIEIMINHIINII